MDIETRRYRTIRSNAQHKLGCDVFRSMWYRENWGEDWQPIAASTTRLRRWTLRKYNHPKSVYKPRTANPRHVIA